MLNGAVGEGERMPVAKCDGQAAAQTGFRITWGSPITKTAASFGYHSSSVSTHLLIHHLLTDDFKPVSV